MMTTPDGGTSRPVTDPEYASAVLREGMVHQRAGALDAAMACYQRIATSTDPALASAGWRHVAGVHRLHSEWDAAIEAARRAARLAEDAGIRELYAEALNAEAIVHQMREDFARATPLLEQMLEITADAKGQGIALQNLGSIAAQQGDFARARKYFLRSHRCFEQAGYTHGVAFVLNNFGRAALDHANARVALPMLEDALGAARRVGDGDLEALVHRNLAEAAVAIDDREGAHGHLDAAERSFAAAGNRARLVECLRLRGELAERELGSDAAREQYRIAHALATEVGALGEVARIAERLTALDEQSPPQPEA
jgi:tetratricopeptide (TPR) repeat protein